MNGCGIIDWISIFNFGVVCARTQRIRLDQAHVDGMSAVNKPPDG